MLEDNSKTWVLNTIFSVLTYFYADQFCELILFLFVIQSFSVSYTHHPGPCGAIHSFVRELRCGSSSL